MDSKIKDIAERICSDIFNNLAIKEKKKNPFAAKKQSLEETICKEIAEEMDAARKYVESMRDYNQRKLTQEQEIIKEACLDLYKELSSQESENLSQVEAEIYREVDRELDWSLNELLKFAKEKNCICYNEGVIAFNLPEGYEERNFSGAGFGLWKKDKNGDKCVGHFGPTASKLAELRTIYDFEKDRKTLSK